MNKHLRILLAQTNPIIGDLIGNAQQCRSILSDAKHHNVDLVIFPELSLCGYSPQDLLLRTDFLTDMQHHVAALHHDITQHQWPTAIIGFAYRKAEHVFNCAGFLSPQQSPIFYYKQQLPNYAVFDEKRYFSAGTQTCVVPFHGVKIALLICEDIWFDQPIDDAIAQHAQLIICINASPFEIGKPELREQRLREMAMSRNIPVIYVNQAGGQDELIFDGHSMCVSSQGKIQYSQTLFDACTTTLNFTIENGAISFTEKQNDHSPYHALRHETILKKALSTGLSDYLKKNRFKNVVLGVSGGVDSALVLALACDAIGAEHVHALILPSRYTDSISIDDARTLCDDFSVQYDIISIEPVFQTYLTHLHSYFTIQEHDLTGQNIQARCRGNILMAYANAQGTLLLTTGNRSELAMGYCTLYGDMAGGFAVIKDLYKQEVYALAETYTAIPKRILTRAPTAELAPNQKDEDTLPPYPILDEVLMRHLDQRQSSEEIASELKMDIHFIHHIAKQIQLNEYKRKQLPIGTRLRHQSFGLDRRYPVTSWYPPK